MCGVEDIDEVGNGAVLSEPHRPERQR